MSIGKLFHLEIKVVWSDPGCKYRKQTAREEFSENQKCYEKSR